MTYTAPEILTFIAALGVLLTGLGAVIVNIIVAVRTGAKLDVTLSETKGLVSQVKEVHTLTNSNLSAVKAELAIAAAQIQALRDVIQDLKFERSKAALTTALHTTVNVPAEQAAGLTLEKIEINTEHTAQNTARTEAAASERKQETLP